MEDAIKDAEDRTGVGAIKMGTPHFRLDGSVSSRDHNARVLDGFAKIGCAVCLPHQCTTDALVDRVQIPLQGTHSKASLQPLAGGAALGN